MGGTDTSAGGGRERIAKAIARAGRASRREAERLIADGRVTVNGTRIASPARTVGPCDRIAVDGVALEPAAPPRLWRYHKPAGLVTTELDEKGRRTVFDALPSDLPRVLSVGRLDLTSEGLLLLTNDGGLKRRMELPATGWTRKYRVRVKGSPDETTLAPLRAGLHVDGERFQPMRVSLDRQQGANAWLTIGLTEGRNREIRRAMAAVGLEVNRLIRVSYGPFQLGDLPPGSVVEVRPRILRDQLGLADPGAGPGDRPKRPATPKRPPGGGPSGPKRSAAPGAAGKRSATGGAKRGAAPARPGSRGRPARGGKRRPGA